MYVDILTYDKQESRAPMCFRVCQQQQLQYQCFHCACVSHTYTHTLSLHSTKDGNFPSWLKQSMLRNMKSLPTIVFCYSHCVCVCDTKKSNIDINVYWRPKKIGLRYETSMIRKVTDDLRPDQVKISIPEQLKKERKLYS